MHARVRLASELPAHAPHEMYTGEYRLIGDCDRVNTTRSIAPHKVPNTGHRRRARALHSAAGTSAHRHPQLQQPCSSRHPT